MRKNGPAGAEFAETLALHALAWLVGNHELLSVFLGATGTSAEELRARAAEPDFLVSTLDFLLMDDAWIVAFCDAAGYAYSDPLAARRALPGGAETHWT
ncbi:MAG: DUF3572 domain-containing protein [Albidovulum sp.]|uniref:DUF3572 domain-containing protein n=1 Tax=Albidovulum sp. TaxID=1872424 RepID=UPI001326C7FE|nr:DUF3572 domain-containing protein [Defluviimonas sp.]KAB2884055.1 MAG: DUF3572 domain-containing protein [Defluviimonas sp.]